jgi:hypothetical protein
LEKLDWDTTLKILITESAGRLLPMLGESGQIKRWLNVELPKTQNLRVDLLAELTSGQLVHFEMQSRNWARMPFRMLEYGVMICRREGRYPIQILIYAGNEPLRMSNHFRAPAFDFRYEIIDLKTLDGARLLESENISDNLMGLLMALEDQVEAIRRILSRIPRLPLDQKLEAFTRLLLTCRMRKLSPEVAEEVKKMSMTLNVETDEVVGPYYRQGVKTGRADMLRDLIKTKFGTIPAWVEDRLAAATPRQLSALARKLLKSSTLEQLFVAKTNSR